MAASSDKSTNSRKPRVNLKDLKKLIDMMRKAELSEVNIEQEGIKIALKRGGEAQVSFAPMPMAAAPVYAPAPAAAAPSSSVPAAAAPSAAAESGGPEIASPMVGTFYRSSSPDSPPFVKEGDKVEVGQTLCIIEAMKLMNEIKAETAGVFAKFCVENAQPVEYGQPLYVLK